MVTIEDTIVKGEMSQKALNMIFDWLSKHKTELLDNWSRAQKGIPLLPINPLV